MNTNKKEHDTPIGDKEHFPGYPKYPAGEDIYKQDKEEEFIEDKSLKTTPNETGAPGADLDVPGAELDDSNEEIGEEDEENNYYSLDEDNQDNENAD
jgi:hypothetical protein